MSTLIIELGILLFSASVLFQLVTLPVEFDASRRADETLQELGILSHDEARMTKKVLGAAALTYVAAAATAIIQLLRLLLILNRRRD
jgi:Zn-dependent membrane protease YugP